VYRATVYAPQPSAAQLYRDERAFPSAVLRYTRFSLPAQIKSSVETSARRSEAELGSIQLPREPPASARATISAIGNSSYAAVYDTARRLARGRRAEYAVVSAVERYLRHGFTYDLTPKLTALPLVTFLTRSRHGYCQQFSGAMALMLRMDGIPARVGVGFEPRIRQAARSQWVVRAIDAHAWTEAFFPSIGWVSFDPTPPETAPSAAAARLSKGSLLGARQSRGADAARRPGRRGPLTAGPSGPAAAAGGVPAGVFVAGGLIALLCLGGVLARRRLDEALRNGDRAIAVEARAGAERAGLAGGGGATLASIGLRLDARTDAAALAYLAAVSDARFGPAGRGGATAAGRAALRRSLGRGRRLRTRLALIALIPPLRVRKRRQA
jgi:hypothetical protein